MTTSGPADLDGVVAVWVARVSELRNSLPALEALLDSRERERATRFRQADDRARFILGRGLLRHGLRRYAPHIPATAEITYSSMGRPLLSGDYDAPRFSISHTRDLVALAFTSRAQVGVDLEYQQPTVDLLELAERILSEDDYRAFLAFSHRERQLAFYRAWTRKEAYLKARGEGIATGLQDVSVSFSPETVTLVSDRREPSATAWRLHTLPVPEDYAGSVAVEDANLRVELLEIRPSGDEIVIKL